MHEASGPAGTPPADDRHADDHAERSSAAESPDAAAGPAAAAGPDGAALPDVPGGAPATARPALSGRRRRRQWRRRLVALAFGLALPFLLLEAGVRAVWESLVRDDERVLLEAESVSLGRALRVESLNNPAFGLRREEGHRTDLFTLDPARGFRHNPGVRLTRTLEQVPPDGLSFTVTTDRHGLRGPDRGPPPDGALRVLVLGDSMTFGEGVEDAEAWPAQLEALLSVALAPRRARVYNAGVVSYGQQEQRAALRELLPLLRPDMVLLQFTVANDVVDNMRWHDDGPGPLREDPYACETLEHHILLTNSLARWSRAYRFAVWRWGRHAIKYRYMMEPASLDRTAALIAEIRDLAAAPGGAPLPFGVVVAPTVVQVEGSPIELLLRTTRLNEGLAARLGAKDVPLLDPREALRSRAGAGERLYIEVDRHWTAAGHRAVAEEAAVFVERLLGAPPGPPAGGG